MAENQGQKILILVWPETSAYNATLRLGRVLSLRGWQVTYAVPTQWQEFIRRQGFEARVIQNLTMPALYSTSTPWLTRLLTSRETANRLLDDLCEALTWVKSEGYALVLLYPTLWHYAPVFRRLGIPYVAIDACLGAVQSADIPPIFSRLQPSPRNRLFYSLRCALAWFGLRYLGAFSHRYRGILQASPANWADRLKDAGKAARHFYLTLTEPLRSPVYYRLLRTARQAGVRIGWGDYGLRLAGPALVLGPQAIDFPQPHPSQPGRLYAGACVDCQRAEDTFDWSQVDGRRPLAYCTIGSHAGYWNQVNRKKLIDSVVLAFKAHPEWQLILQAATEDLASLGPLPANVLAAAWFPQLQTMQRASLVISHGGFGTLREALFYAVPLLVYPLGVDQPGNAARVVYHHLGLAGDIRKVTPSEIAAKVNILLSDSTYRSNALRISQSLQADNDCDRAIAFLDTFVHKEPEPSLNSMD